MDSDTGMRTRQIPGDFPAQGLGSPELPKSPPPPPPPRRQPVSQQQSETLKCPRCGSDNTKFCYYNNYNKSQPRHFCKSCKRHWTRGGTLRSVPVGGGRKNKRPKIPGDAKTTACGGGGRRDRHFSPLDSNVGDNRKSMSNGLYHALMSSPIQIEKSDNGPKIISSSSPFQFSSPSLFETSDSLNHECLDAFGPHQGNLDSIEESTITSANNVPTYIGDGSLDLLDYWNWNEIDLFTSYDDFDISFDGIKP